MDDELTNIQYGILLGMSIEIMVDNSNSKE